MKRIVSEIRCVLWKWGPVGPACPFSIPDETEGSEQGVVDADNYKYTIREGFPIACKGTQESVGFIYRSAAIQDSNIPATTGVIRAFGFPYTRHWTVHLWIQTDSYTYTMSSSVRRICTLRAPSGNGTTEHPEHTQGKHMILIRNSFFFRSVINCVRVCRIHSSSVDSLRYTQFSSALNSCVSRRTVCLF